MKNLIYVICIFSSFVFSVNGQSSVKRETGQKDATKEQKNNNRWKPTLDLLIQEARTLSPKEKRPNAIAEVADAYWNLDSQIARDIFIEANDVALSLEKREDKAKAFRYVLSLVTKRDSTLAKTLFTTAEKSGKLKSEVDDAAIETANELLDEDIIKSAELAEKIAPSGLRYGNAMYLIFQIAKKNPDLANRVYQIYLNKVLADENFPLELSAYLLGYAFGHSDYYSISANGDSSGASLVLPESLIVNRNWVNSFPAYLFRRISRDLQNPASTAQNQFKKMVMLFTIDYIIDEIALYSPNALTSWEQLRQQTIIGLDSSQIEQISNHVRSIKERRREIKRRMESPEAALADKDVSPEEIEKLPDVCQRDRLYAKNAINALSIKNFDKAGKWIDEVEDLKREEVIKTYFHFEYARYLADKSEWSEVSEHAKKVSDDRLKALLFIQLAKKAIEQKQTETASIWLQDSYKLSSKLESLDERKSALFELASIQPNDTEARDLFSEAIKLFNRSTEQESKNFSFLIKIPLSCNDDSQWFGGMTSLKNGNLLASLGALAGKEAEALLPIVQNLENIPIRIKATALLVQKALESEKRMKNS